MNDEQKYIESLVRDYGPLYEKALKSMFNELIDNGWNINIELYCKEKYGVFFCKVLEDNGKLQKIADKHVDIINSICDNCGKSVDSLVEDEDSFWIAGICFECWKERIEIKTINDITKDGFSVSMIDDKNQVELVHVDWLLDVKNYEVSNIVKLLLYDENHLGLIMELYDGRFIHVDNTYINFYKLLKQAPNHTESEDARLFVEKFRTSLKDCPICKKVSIFEKRCLSCGLYKMNIFMGNSISGPLWGDDSWKWFNNIDERIHYERKHFVENLKKDPVLKYRFENDESFSQSDRFL